jgi:hypothetical protein
MHTETEKDTVLLLLVQLYDIHLIIKEHTCIILLTLKIKRKQVLTEVKIPLFITANTKYGEQRGVLSLEFCL